MARVYSSGGELQSVTAGVEFAAVTGSPSISTTTVRSGSAALRTNASGSEVSVKINEDPGAADSYFWRVYVRFASFPASLTKIIQISDAGGDHTSIRVNSNGTLELWQDQGTGSPQQWGSDSSALSTDTWYRIELKTAEAASGDDIEAKIDGSVFASNATHPVGANTRFMEVGVMGSVTADVFFDDIGINNDTGSVQNSYPGAGQIVHAYPNGAGDNAATTGLYTAIDEVTPNDSDYIEIDGTETPEYACQDSSDLGINSGDTVTLIQVGARVRGETATSCSWQPRIKSASGGTTTTGDTTTIASASFATHDDTTSGKYYKLTSYTDPTTASAWTPTGTNSIDNMQIGASAPDNDPDVWISSMWALIEVVELGTVGGGDCDFTFANLGSSANPDINDTTDGTSFSNSSWTPPTSGLIVVFIHNRGASGPDTPSVSGNSLTWTTIETATDGDSDGQLTLVAANASGSTTGATTVSYSNTVVHCSASFFHITGVDLSSGVAGAFVQTPKAENQPAATSGSITLSAASNAGHRPISCFHHIANESSTGQASWTTIDDLSGGGRARGVISQYRSDAFETTASASWSTSSKWCGIAAEIKCEVAAASAVFTFKALTGVGL